MSTPTEGTGPEIAELQLYTIEEAMTMLRMGRTMIFDLLRNGRLHSVREGRARRIPARAIAEHIALLERENEPKFRGHPAGTSVPAVPGQADEEPQ